jgi:hypothetical protein
MLMANRLGESLMNQTAYHLMSNQELKRYFLENRGDRAAVQAYLDQINQHPPRVIARLDDPDFDEKVQTAIRHKLGMTRGEE